MSKRLANRLINVAASLLILSLLVQFATGTDFRGVPHIVFALAVGAIWIARVFSVKRKPVEKPEA